MNIVTFARRNDLELEVLEDLTVPTNSRCRFSARLGDEYLYVDDGGPAGPVEHIGRTRDEALQAVAEDIQGKEFGRLSFGDSQANPVRKAPKNLTVE